MAIHLPHLAPSRPAIHLATPTGWLNDPNGLCFHDGLWHAFYQHDPNTDVHGTMHWGHATSLDLLHWTHHPIALAPDELGAIFSGSVVIDHDDTAGFGAGAMVAIFTHHLGQVERQSLASSTDGGHTWAKFEGNPVLESDAVDFRDPKVFRYCTDHGTAWVMVLAVGHRIEFYRSADLKKWVLSGVYEADLPGVGVWECPDLIPIRTGNDVVWLLMFGAVGVGPHGHSGTLVVPGTFAGEAFEPTGAPRPIDLGPDFYAAQSFSGDPSTLPTMMGWMNSWRYSGSHPSAGWRGILSLPRHLEVSGGDCGLAVRSRPAGPLRVGPTLEQASAWTSTPDCALHVAAAGEVLVTVVDAQEQSVATITIADGRVRLQRGPDIVAGYAQSYEAPISGTGTHEVVVDHGTVEVFADDGAATVSALVFPGAGWRVLTDGDAELRAVC